MSQEAALKLFLKSYWNSRPALEPKILKNSDRNGKLHQKPKLTGSQTHKIRSANHAVADCSNGYDLISCLRKLDIETACLSLMSNTCSPAGVWPNLRLQPSDRVGYGVFAQNSIEAGTVIGLYPGTLSTKPPRSEKQKNYSIAFDVPVSARAECQKTLQNIGTAAKPTHLEASAVKTVYVTAFDHVLPTVAGEQKAVGQQHGLSPPIVWDLQNGFRSQMWYINDDPFAANCAYQAETSVEGFPKIQVVALKDIRKDEELLCNYGTVYFASRSKHVPDRLALCGRCRKRSKKEEVQESNVCPFCKRQWAR